ncbi:MAG: hypothetical protein DMG65_00920 [Candidatus Angelobacter sp. Gp1-AA117]|nr:MAG: hypothetical protein DMG65_00920 [Candidatus Angelobacter sp. Gp1-AA117]
MPIHKPGVRITVVFFVLLGLAGNGMARTKHRNATTQTVPETTRSLLLEAAMRIEQTDMDCSHLVHYLYNRVGLIYNYVPSNSLYQGATFFLRTFQPQPGDLIVWRGHVGVVVDPEEHTFISALRTGVKIASYDSRYWKAKGRPRFLRYTGPALPPELAESASIVSLSNSAD